MNSITRFFWFCSGAYIPLLKKTPTETHKYVGIGGTVFFTGLLASLSGGYALFTVFESIWYALGFALVWGLMIFNLDRFIVSSMKKRNNAWSEWKMAFPRLLFAIILAIVISRPLELKIFEKEINRKLDEKRTAMIAESKDALKAGFSEIDVLEFQKDSLKQEISQATAFRDKLQQEYDDERFGAKTGQTSGIVGLGTNAKKKEQQLDAAQQALDALRLSHQERIDQIEEEIRQWTVLRQAEFEKLQPGIEGFDGLAARLEALDLLSKESEAIKWANLFILLLFVAIETAPIFVKLIVPRGPYDEMLELSEKGVTVFVKEQSFKLEKGSAKRQKDFERKLELTP